MHRETPHNLVSDFSVRIMGSSSGLGAFPAFRELHQGAHGNLDNFFSPRSQVHIKIERRRC
ncbi:hypothetical protein C6M98_11700 [Corynebacterium diphtheriae]|nr:hypothetical protein A6J36_11895 [Corynebacterium diphtheriae]PTN66915.1 hypothetical protein C6M98_11700 [Corynebacterium diphtheriae]